MQKFLTFIRNNKLYSGAAVAVVILLIAIGATVFALTGSDKNDTETATTTSTTKNKDENYGGTGRVSKLNGRVTSLRNLQGLTIRINQIDTCGSDSIAAYISVSTDAGVVNTNFNKQDITVYLDGKKVSNFGFNAVNSQQPINNVLAIDHSGSMTGAPIENAKAAAKSYIDSLNGGDKVAIIQFDDRVETLSALTADKAAAKAAVDGIAPRGNTSIYDAANQSVKTLPECGRKAITLLSDGEDTSSSSDINSVISSANSANLPIFSVGLASSDFKPTVLQQIANGTGGQFLQANQPGEISAIYANISGQLKGQFRTNVSVPTKKNGGVHTLKIVSNVSGSPTSSERSFIF